MKHAHCNYTKAYGDPQRKSDEGKHHVDFLKQSIPYRD
jgi:hypothetical protein